MTESPWFDPHDKPVRKGVYRVMHPVYKLPYWAKWTGKHWCNRWYYYDFAKTDRGRGDIQELLWKGIVK